VGVPAGLPHGADLVVQRGPVFGEDVSPGYYNVDLLCAGTYRGPDFIQPLLQGRESGREAGRDRRHRNARSFQCLDSSLHERVINADCCGVNRQLPSTHALEQVEPNRSPRLGAEAADPARGVIALKSGEIEQGHGSEQPGRLPVALDRAAGSQRCSPAFHRTAIDPGLFNPVQLEWHTGISGGDRHLERTPLVGSGAGREWRGHA